MTGARNEILHAALEPPSRRYRIARPRAVGRTQRQEAAERPVCVKPHELRIMLAYVGLSDHRADAAVRLLAFVGEQRNEERNAPQ